MINRTTRLRWRRTVRQSRRQVEDLGQQAEEQLDRHLFRRVGRLIEVRRFVVSWMLLVVLLVGGVILQTRTLSNYYETLRPVRGGSFTEGELGSFTNASPLYATGLVDSSVTKLLFASLLKIDQNGQLVGDLASKWTSDDRGVQYTVTLRNNLLWHDGQPLTAEDVLFTYKTIQNPDAESPLFSSWQGIKLSSPDPHTVIFTLPSSLSSFPFSLTNGIVPKHLLATVPVTQLRSAPFNTVNPIGSGPFMWDRLEVTGGSPETRQEKIGFKPFSGYYAGAPKLDHLIIRSFLDAQGMTKSFERNELDGMVGLDTVSNSLKNSSKITEYNVPLAAEVAVFLKTSNPIFSDVKVRQAVVQSVDESDIIQSLGYPVVAANSPLLRGQVGYDKSLVQLPRDLVAANRLLDEAGWVKGSDGLRTKNKQTLSFNLVTQNTSEYANVIKHLQQQLRTVGIDVRVSLQTSADLQGTLARHDYDALLYAIDIGPDPDVFAYWHSSQADPHTATRLNFSEYKSAAADKALEAGRTRTDATIRTIKYRPFLQAWHDDAPAVVLYQPRFLYVSTGTVYNFAPRSLDEAADRFTNVDNWMVRQQKQPQS